MIAALALATTLSAASAASAPRVPAPVAVMPFKNLNDDPGLDWLRSGIAETMITDLRKSASIDIVEREQLDKALGEVMLQNAKATDEATAVKVGKLVGAKTVVLGSFQQAEKEIRINARFVNVETGAVIDTAKATGPSSKIFALQDEVVDKLLGKAPAGRPKRSGSDKTLQAYRLYAMALTVASDADRVGYLKKSLDVDPDFVYAKDELAALELRLGGYQKVHVASEDAAIAAYWKTVDDPKATTTERATAANALLLREQHEHRYHAILDDANRIIAANIPSPGPGFEQPTAFALFMTMESYTFLKKPDLAMQAGERYLKEYPAGLWYATVDQQLRSMIEARHKQQESGPKLDERLGALAKERDDALAHAKENEAARPGLAMGFRIRARRADLERCWWPAGWAIQRYDVAQRECEAFAAAYAKDPDARVDVLQARMELIEATAELGQFDRARKDAESFLAEIPHAPGVETNESQFARRLEGDMKSWPAD